MKFMKAFNSFYYSFSPTIANAIASSDSVAASARLLLSPFVGILQTSSCIFEMFRFAPEAGMVATGLFNSALLGILYLTPISFASRLLRKIANVHEPPASVSHRTRARWSEIDCHLTGASQ